MSKKELSFEKIEGFDWDEGNLEKNWRKHRVSNKETEEVFINKPHFIFEDFKHSTKEKRFTIIGKTNSGRLLIVFFTVRGNNFRIISARDQNRKERREYEQKIKTNTKV